MVNKFYKNPLEGLFQSIVLLLSYFFNNFNQEALF